MSPFLTHESKTRYKRGLPQPQCERDEEHKLNVAYRAPTLQPYPQKVFRPPNPTPTTFSGGSWSPIQNHGSGVRHLFVEENDCCVIVAT